MFLASLCLCIVSSYLCHVHYDSST